VKQTFCGEQLRCTLDPYVGEKCGDAGDDRCVFPRSVHARHVCPPELRPLPRTSRVRFSKLTVA
jgi:hypothetical protein